MGAQEYTFIVQKQVLEEKSEILEKTKRKYEKKEKQEGVRRIRIFLPYVLNVIYNSFEKEVSSPGFRHVMPRVYAKNDTNYVHKISKKKIKKELRKERDNT